MRHRRVEIPEVDDDLVTGMIATDWIRSAATNQRYFPEWILSTYGPNDINAALDLGSDPIEQFRNAFGTTFQRTGTAAIQYTRTGLDALAGAAAGRSPSRARARSANAPGPPNTALFIRLRRCHPTCRGRAAGSSNDTCLVL